MEDHERIWLYDILIAAEKRIKELEKAERKAHEYIQILYGEAVDKGVRMEEYVSELKARIAELEEALKAHPKAHT